MLQSGRSRQTIAALIASMSVLILGFISGWLSPSVEKLMSDNPPVRLTHSETSWIMAASNLGATLSPLPSALLMDSLGRRNTLRLLTSLPVLGWLLTYCATSFSHLYTARCLAGTWIGVAITVAPVYIGEVVEPSYRSVLSSFITLMQYAGIILVFAIGYYVSYWTLDVFGLSFSCLFWCLLIFIPESPYYYALNNEKQKAIESLKWLRGDRNVDEEFKKIDKFIEADRSNKCSVMNTLSDPGNRKAIIIVLTITVLMRASGVNLLMVLPIIIPKNAFLSITNDDCTMIVVAVYLIGSFRMPFLTRYGIKPLLMVSGFGCGIAMTGMTLWEYFKNTYDFVQYDLYWIPFVCFMVHAAFSAIGMGPIAVSLKGEISPTELKSILSALATILGNSCSCLILKCYIGISEMFGAYINFIIASAACYSTVLFTYFYVIETEGKSLQEIQLELNTRRKDKKNFSLEKF